MRNMFFNTLFDPFFDYEEFWRVFDNEIAQRRAQIQHNSVGEGKDNDLKCAENHYDELDCQMDSSDMNEECYDIMLDDDLINEHDIVEVSPFNEWLELTEYYSYSIRLPDNLSKSNVTITLDGEEQVRVSYEQTITEGGDFNGFTSTVAGSRVFSLPENVYPDTLTASLNNFVLTLEVKKKIDTPQVEYGSRKIEIL